MLKNICVVLSLSFLSSWVVCKPASLELDKLNADLLDLSYEVEEEDLDDYGKILDAIADNKKGSTKTSGVNKNRSAKKGTEAKKKTEDLKRFFNLAGASDKGSYDDDDVHLEADAVAASAVGITGKEDRKYRKGTKTRGFHKVHRKDEYKKDKVIYEDDETSGIIRKVGAKGSGFEVDGGVGLNRGHFDHKHKKGAIGKKGLLDKVSVNQEVNAYKDSQGFDRYFNNSE